MQHQEIIQKINTEAADPDAVVHVITMRSVLAEIVLRLGEDALLLTPEDFELAKEQTREAIHHHLDERELIQMGIDAWQIIRSL